MLSTRLLNRSWWLVILTIVLSVRTACAQGEAKLADDDFSPDDEAVDNVPLDVDAPPGQMRFGLTDQHFQSLLGLRRVHEMRFRFQLQQTCATYHLSEIHKQKLMIAGRADILTYLESVRKLRDECFSGPAKRVTALHVRDEFLRLNQVGREFPFRMRDSLYEKVLLRILRVEGIARQDFPYLDDPAAVEALREIEYYESLVKLIDVQLAEVAPLRDKKQRIQLGEMLRQALQTTSEIRSEQPEKIWERLSEIPAERWTPLLDDAQWKHLRRKFD